jgi:type VI secretion system secreted protein Hcp
VLRARGPASPDPSSACLLDIRRHSYLGPRRKGEATAAIDYFLKLDGISGESKDSKHKGEIEVLSFTFGEAQSGSSGSGGGAGAGKVQMTDFSFTARTTKASPQLFLHCAQGKHIKQAILTVRKAGGSQQEYLIIKLNDVLVSSYALGSGVGESEGEPHDAFALNFVKLSYDYKPQKADGSLDAPVHAGWDLSKNVKI